MRNIFALFTQPIADKEYSPVQNHRDTFAIFHTKGEGRKLPKHDAKSANFLSDACINEGNFSVSFSSKIFSGS